MEFELNKRVLRETPTGVSAVPTENDLKDEAQSVWDQFFSKDTDVLQFSSDFDDKKEYHMIMDFSTLESAPNPKGAYGFYMKLRVIPCKLVKLKYTRYERGQSFLLRIPIKAFLGMFRKALGDKNNSVLKGKLAEVRYTKENKKTYVLNLCNVVEWVNEDLNEYRLISKLFNKT